MSGDVPQVFGAAKAKALKMLKVLVKGATNLPDVDRFSGKSDPYAVVSFRGK